MSLAPLLVLLTCLVASVSYIGAVTQSALATMVLPMVLAVGALATLLRARPPAAVLTVVLVSGAGGEAVNILSGNYEGSAARSAGVASLATGLAVVVSATRRPGLFLCPVVAIVAWALALGAGARVELVAVITAAFGLLGLAAVERDRRTFVSPPRLAGGALLSVILLVATGIFAAQFQLHHDSRPAASPFRESLATTIEPPAVLSLTRHPPRSATQSVPPPPEASLVAKRGHSRVPQVLRGLLWGGISLLGILLVAAIGRMLWVSLSWHRLRRRLERRVLPVEAGAWAWTLASFERLGAPLQVHISPDIAMANSESPSESFRAFAGAVAPVIFISPGAETLSSDIWHQARAVVDEAWMSAGRSRRVKARWQVPRRTGPVRSG